MIYPVSEDSVLLLRSALKEVKEDDVVLEVGTGSGFVAERIKDRCKYLVATDISPFSVKSAYKAGLRVVRADLVRCFKRKFSLVLFNPPYLELEEFEKRDEWIERALDGGKKGLDVIKRFLKELDDVLVDGGRCVLIHSSFNIPEIYDIVERNGFRSEILERKKVFFEELYAIKISKR
jgi:release factor glutamine methyltransferase